MHEWKAEILRRLVPLNLAPTREAEITEELSQHLEDRYQELISRGHVEDEAFRAALDELKGEDLLERSLRLVEKNFYREPITPGSHAPNFLSGILQDIRYAFRMLRKSPGFTAVAILTLALGIGANTALFSVVNGVLLNPLPYPHPDQVVVVAGVAPGFAETSISYPDYLDWVRDNQSFSYLAAYKSFMDFDLLGQGEPQRVTANLVTATFFPTLGVTPVLGRNFTPAEDQLNGPPAAILSGGFWKTKFASSPNIIGKTLNLDGTAYTVVGVLPDSFYFCCRGNNFLPAEVYVPLGAYKSSFMQNRKMHPGIRGVGRLKQEVTLAQARADMDRIARNLASEYPDADKGTGISVVPVKDEMVRNIRPVLLVLLAAVGFVLLIACVNVTNLLLARSTGRAREFAIRAALGAGQGRIIRQLLTETLLLAIAGSAFGLLIAAWGASASLSILPSSLPRTNDVRLDARVLLFTLAISLLAGILFGLAPALKTSRTDSNDVLKEGGRGASGARYRNQGVFVVAEMALAVVLLIGAGLAIRTLVGLWSVNPGFDPHNVLAFTVGFPLSDTNGDAAQIRADVRQLTDKIATVPGVSAVSVMNGAFPMSRESDFSFYIDGTPKPANDQEMLGGIWYDVGPDYLRVMRIPLLRGRFIGPQDNDNSPGVCVIDEDLARKYFHNENPIGKILDFEDVYKQLQIVGVVGHVKQFGLDENASSPVLPQFYTASLQLPDSLFKSLSGRAGYIVRTDGPPDTFISSIRNATQRFNSKAVLFDTDTMDHIVSQSLASRRFAMILLGVFATLALVLASIGIYGVISYIVGQRTHEIGIRLALGAQRSDVLKMVLGQAASLALLGVAIGLVVSAALTRLMAKILYGVSATDPLTFAVVGVLLTLVALAACYIPARRAMRVDPMVALHYE